MLNKIQSIIPNLKKSQPPQSQGQKAEAKAKKHLQSKGYRFIAQNFHCRFGEIDLIFLDGDQLVFVEVKQRSKDSLSAPEEAITPSKLQKIIITANLFIKQHPQLPQSARIDALTLGDSLKVLRHLKNISQ